MALLRTILNYCSEKLVIEIYKEFNFESLLKKHITWKEQVNYRAI